MKIDTLATFKNRRGFTLVEILVVIAIIAVLATMTVFGLGFYKRKANQSKSKILVASVSRALDDYKSDEGSYPTGDGSDTSSTVLYEVLFGDVDGDGESDDDATIYLDSLSPTLTGQALNVKEDGGSYLVVDGFKNALRYRSPGEQNPGTDFDLWSLGSDGEEGTPDDLDNW